jgi:NADH-quinone oxidoreductase subunit F
MVQILQRMQAGNATEADLDTQLDTCDNIFARAFSALADGATSPIVSGVKLFREEFLQHLSGGCPFDPVASTLFGGVRS